MTLLLNLLAHFQLMLSLFEVCAFLLLSSNNARAIVSYDEVPLLERVELGVNSREPYEKCRCVGVPRIEGKWSSILSCAVKKRHITFQAPSEPMNRTLSREIQKALKFNALFISQDQQMSLFRSSAKVHILEVLLQYVPNLY